MIPMPAGMRIWVACGATDMRRGFDGLTHGMSYTRTYDTWNGMMQRCYNPNAPKFPLYGERGVVVCERWHSFEEFYAEHPCSQSCRKR